MDTFTLANTTRTKPRLPFTELKNDILGKNYTLQVVLIGKQRARALNIQTRNKSYVPNVLSFPLTKTHGEIYITPEVAKQEAKRARTTIDKRIGFLYIHGLLHLHGLNHGKRMEDLEQQYIKKYKLT